eukprot:GHVU01147655.1.p1 GENE.GHVU01147655.1~~GHVU01147655.1.p1  ORF type:complete len:362 (-),score=88.64 GHVU01147655.1:192-1277(-)
MCFSQRVQMGLTARVLTTTTTTAVLRTYDKQQLYVCHQVGLLTEEEERNETLHPLPPPFALPGIVEASSSSKAAAAAAAADSVACLGGGNQGQRGPNQGSQQHHHTGASSSSHPHQVVPSRGNQQYNANTMTANTLLQPVAAGGAAAAAADNVQQLQQRRGVPTSVTNTSLRQPLLPVTSVDVSRPATTMQQQQQQAAASRRSGHWLRRVFWPFGASSSRSAFLVGGEPPPPQQLQQQLQQQVQAVRSAAVRVEPKTFFANERTLLQWMNTAVLLATISITLLNYGSHQSRIAGLIMAPVAIFFIAYSFWVYLRRSRALERKEAIDYNDRVGPAVLVCTLIVALSSMLILNILGSYRAQQL